MGKIDDPKKQFDACTPVNAPYMTTAARSMVKLDVEKQAVRAMCCEDSNAECFGSVTSFDYEYYKKIIDGKTNQCIKLTVGPADVHCGKDE